MLASLLLGASLVSAQKVRFERLTSDPSATTVAVGSAVPLDLRTQVDLADATIVVSDSTGPRFTDTDTFKGFSHYDKNDAITGCFTAQQCTRGAYAANVKYWSKLQTDRGVISKTDRCSAAIQKAVGSTVDGWYGAGTETAVKDFQRAQNSKVSDGRCLVPCHNTKSLGEFPDCPATTDYCGADGCGGQCAAHCCDDANTIMVDGFVGAQTWPRIRNAIEAQFCQVAPLLDLPDNDGFPALVGQTTDAIWNEIADEEHLNFFHYSSVLRVSMPLASIPVGDEDAEPRAIAAGSYTGVTNTKGGDSFSFAFTVVDPSCDLCDTAYTTCMQGSSSIADPLAKAGAQCSCGSTHLECLRSQNPSCGDDRVAAALTSFNTETSCPTNDFAALTTQCAFCHPVTGGCQRVPLSGKCQGVFGDAAYVAVIDGTPQLGDLLVVDADTCDSYQQFTAALHPDIFWRADYPAECEPDPEDYNPFSVRGTGDDTCYGCHISATYTDGRVRSRSDECTVNKDLCRDAWHRLRCSVPRNTVFCSPMTWGVDSNEPGATGGQSFIAPLKPYRDTCERFRDTCAPNFVVDDVLGSDLVQGDKCTYVPWFEGKCNQDVWADKRAKEYVGLRNFTLNGLLPNPETCNFDRDAACCDAWADKEWFVDDDDDTGPGDNTLAGMTTTVNDVEHTCVDVGGPNYPEGTGVCHSAQNKFNNRSPSRFDGPKSCCKHWRTDSTHPLYPNSNELAGCRRAAQGHFDLSFITQNQDNLGGLLRNSAPSLQLSATLVAIALAYNALW